MLFHAATFQLLHQVTSRGRRVPDDAHVHTVERADDLLVEVHLNHASAGREEPAVAHGPAIERGSEGEHHVRTPHQLDGERRREPTGDAKLVGVAGKEPVPDGASRQERPDPLAQSLQCFAASGERGSPAGQYHRPFTSGEQVRDLGDRASRRTWRLQSRRLGWKIRFIWRVQLHEVYRDVQHYGTALYPGAAQGAGGVFGGGFGGTDVLGYCSDGLGERGLIYLEVRPQCSGRRIRSQQHERRAALGGLRQPRKSVREARPLVDACDADLPRDPRVSVGHRDGCTFVAGGVELSTGVSQGVHHSEVAATDETEERLDPTPGERTSDRFGHLHLSPLRALWMFVPPS